VSWDGQQVLSATYHDQALASPPSLAKFTRLVLFDANKPGSPPLLSIPFIPSQLTRLQVVNARAAGSSLSVQGWMRCWLPLTAGEHAAWVDLTICPALLPQAKKASQWTLQFVRSTILGDLPTSLVLEKLAGQETPDARIRFRLPPVARTIGLTGKNLLENLLEKRFLKFLTLGDPWLGQSQVDATKVPSIRMQFREELSLDLKTVLLEPLTQSITPFPAEFSADELPDQKCVLRVRQPNGESWDQSFGRHWIVEVDLPRKTALGVWNSVVVDPVVESLKIVRAGLPESWLPQFEELDDPGTWIAQYSVCFRQGCLNRSG
jgi:hypothetical protein